MSQSLFKACKNIIRNNASGVQNVGGYDIEFEYYTQNDIDINNTKIKTGTDTACTFGDSDESKVVLIAGETITIPSTYTLTPVYPKKSLVILCNTFVNDGVVSMSAKGPDVLPHNWYIVGVSDGYSEKVVIPAYAENNVQSETLTLRGDKAGTKGNDGTNRCCGSGGTGCLDFYYGNSRTYTTGASGSGYAFGGGAGSGGISEAYGSGTCPDVDLTYPMHGGSGLASQSGVGTTSSSDQNLGVGGRIIIFCNSFTNNGYLSCNGVSARHISSSDYRYGIGGASGGGAIDIFYTNMILLNSDNISVTGGTGSYHSGSGSSGYSGAGGDGCVTLSDGEQAPLWTMPDCFKPQKKKCTNANWTYLFSQYVTKYNEEI